MPSLLACCCISDPSKCMCQCYMLQGLQACTPNAHATKTAPFHTRKAPLAKSTCTSSSAAAFSFAMKSFEETTTPISTCTIQMQKVPLASQHPVRRTNHCKQSKKNTNNTNNTQISAQKCIQLVPRLWHASRLSIKPPKSSNHTHVPTMLLRCSNQLHKHTHFFIHGRRVRFILYKDLQTLLSLGCIRPPRQSAVESKVCKPSAYLHKFLTTKIFRQPMHLDASDRPANKQLSPKYANQAHSHKSLSLQKPLTDLLLLESSKS